MYGLGGAEIDKLTYRLGPPNLFFFFSICLTGFSKYYHKVFEFGFGVKTDNNMKCKM